MDDMRNLEFYAPFHLRLPAGAHDEELPLEILSPQQYHTPQVLAPRGLKRSLWVQYGGNLVTAPSAGMGLCRCLIEFGQMVGCGAFGVVVKARSRRGGQAYAMKIIKKTRAVSERQTDNVDREARLLLNMKSPFVCKAFDAFQDIENLYIAMDFISGGDLANLIALNTRFSESTTRFYAAELILAISYIHSRGITHHDIKPANILITRDGHVKLSDFGLARLNDTSPYQAGTPEYMAPEQFKRNVRVTQCVDWYALGIVMYNMLTGVSPYIGDSDMWSRVMEQGPIAIPWPARIFKNVTVKLVSGLLRTDPDTRMGSRAAWDIMTHPWFSDVHWQSVARLEVKPPFIPRLVDDTRMLAGAHAVNLHTTGELYDQYYHLFPAFRRAECCASIPNARPY